MNCFRSFVYPISILCVASVLLACSGGAGSSATAPSVGYVVDAPVQGLAYQCGALSGVTGSDGSFLYDANTACTFKIGNVTLGALNSAPSDGIVTPFDLAGVSRSDNSNPNAVAIAQFIQTIGTSSGGAIQIPAEVVNALGTITNVNIINNGTALSSPALISLVKTATNNAVTALVPASTAATAMNSAITAQFPNLDPCKGAVQACNSNSSTPSSSSSGTISGGSSSNPPSSSGSVVVAAPNLTTAPGQTLTAVNTTVGFSAVSDINSTGYYVLLAANQAAPSAAQIIAGTNASGVGVSLSGNAPLVAGVATNFSIGNLSYSSAYKLYFVASTSASAVSNVAVSSIATGAQPLPPNLTPSFSGSITPPGNTISFTLTSDVTATAYYVILPSTSSIPSATQIIAGKDANNVTASISGSGAMSAGVTKSFSGIALAYSSNYVLYLTATNIADAKQIASVSSATITTDVDPNTVTTSITVGDPGALSSSSLISWITPIKKFLGINSFGVISKAYATSSPCSVNSQKLVTYLKSGNTKTVDVVGSSNGSLSVDDGSGQECITAMQDATNFIAFSAPNIVSGNSVCDLLFYRKSDSKIFCSHPDLASALPGVNTAGVKATYQIGAIDTGYVGADWTGVANLNNGGYKAYGSQNGKYFIASFKVIIGADVYIGVTKFNLQGAYGPTSTIAWLKKQTIDASFSGYTYYSPYLSSFIGLENGDVILNYFDINDGGSWPPVSAAKRGYIAVNDSITNPSLQPFNFLWQSQFYGGNYGPIVSGTGLISGSLADYVMNNAAALGVPTFRNIQGTLLSITSDPSSSARSIFVTIQGEYNATPNTPYTVLQVTFNSDASIAGVSSLGKAGDPYAQTVYGGNLYNLSRIGIPYGGGYSAKIISHSMTQGANAADVDVFHNSTPGAFTFSVFRTKDYIFLLEGFNNYFGGNMTGSNKVYAYNLKTGAGSQVSLSKLTNSSYTLTVASANYLSNQLQMVGAIGSNQWTAVVDINGVSQLRTYPAASTLPSGVQNISLQDQSGTAVKSISY